MNAIMIRHADPEGVSGGVQLFNAWERGEPSVSTAAMFAELEFETTSRLRDIFKGHRDWKALIEAKGGACRLRVAELLEEQHANAD